MVAHRSGQANAAPATCADVLLQRLATAFTCRQHTPTPRLSSAHPHHNHAPLTCLRSRSLGLTAPGSASSSRGVLRPPLRALSPLSPLVRAVSERAYSFSAQQEKRERSKI